ncbi:MAG: prephenate dehydratase [Gammaproteobacteria bacterium]|nr:prephenate dehydratase [Gammaproteobacteria bacterium]
MGNQPSLEELRSAIDELDDSILELICKRAEMASLIIKAKNVDLGQEDCYRPEREAQVLRRLIEQNNGLLSDENIASIFREIMSSCLALQQQLRIAYLGPAGTFTQTAALKHFGHAIHCEALGSIDQVFREVESATCNYGVVPIENSIEGVVNHTLDMLMNCNLYVCGEVELRIHHHLLSKARDLESINHIYAHQQSFAQCRSWLDAHIQTAERIAVNSNAEGARRAAEDSNAGAIAGQAAMEEYGLQKLAGNIEDEPDNTTRFLIIGRQQAAPSGNDKTSLLFAAPNKPGALHRLLACFANNNVSMTRIESRPSRRGMWDYVFFVDVEGHISDEPVKKSVDELEEHASMVKLLGSYPRAVL